MSKRWSSGWRSIVATSCAALIAGLLPWQTRWMFGQVLIDGAHTEYGVMSLFAVEILVFLGLIAVLVIRSSRTEASSLALRLGAIAIVVMILGTTFVSFGAYSLATLIHVVLAFALFFLLLSEEVSFPIVFLAFVFGLLPSIVSGFIQVFSGASPASSWFGLASRSAMQLGDAVFTLDGERVLRAYGTFSHPNVFAGYLGVALFGWWYALAQFRSHWSRKVYIFLGSFGTLLLIAGLLVTGSRSAFLGVLLGIVLFAVSRLVRSSRARAVVLSAIAFGVVGTALFSSVVFADVAADLRGGGVHEERSLTERISLYEEYVPFVQAMNPWIGYGAGSYVLSYANFDAGKAVYEYQPIHNAWLLMFAEVGVLGAISLFVFCGFILKHLFSSLKYPFASYALGMVGVLFVISCFDHYLWSSWAGLALVAITAASVLRLGTSSN